MPSNILLEHALQYASRGWRVVPLHSIEQSPVDPALRWCSCRKGQACPTPGKHPRIKTGKDHVNASCDPAQIEAWWRKWPDANIGLVGFTVVDVDGQAGLEFLTELIRENSPLPETLTAQSGRDGIGLHFYYQPEQLRNSSGNGLDLRAAGGLVVAPPSMHASGRRYRWLKEVPIGALTVPWFSWFGKRRTNQESKKSQGEVSDSFAGLGTVPAFLRRDGGSGLAARALGAVDVLPPLPDVAAAVALLPNEDVGWDAWSDRGMLVYASTGGSADGRELFRAWSRKSRKHTDDAVDERWSHWAHYPPTEFSFGSLVHMCRELEPGWDPPSRRKVLVDPHRNSEAKNATQISGGNPFDTPAAMKMNGVHSVAATLPLELTQGTDRNPLIKLNEQYAVIGDIGGKCLVLGWVPSKVDQVLKVPSFQTFKSFAERYASTYIMTKHENSKGETVEEPKQIGAYWLKWTGRRSFEGIELEPGGAPVLPGKVMNLWSGFAVEPVAGSWRRMQEHIVAVLAGGDAEAARYIVRFAAWAVQHPGERAEVALVFRGGKGSGKGTFANALRRLFGQHGLQIFSPKHLVGSFNGHLRNCLLLFADEAFWAGDKQGESVLKGMLTESVLMIEDKGVNAVQWRNRLHVIMAANAEWVVPASHDERRYAVFDVSNARIGDRGYFHALHAEIAQGGLSAMLHDLLAMDLGDWHPRDILHNEALRAQKERSLDGKHSWLEYVLQSGVIPGSYKDADMALANNLLQAAMPFETRHGEVNHTSLGRFLRGWKVTGWHTKDGTIWKFPPLDELRAAWSNKFGSWPWRVNLSEWQKRA